jgi:hypothetical protein
MRTNVDGLTYESQITHLPSHFSHNRPIAIKNVIIRVKLNKMYIINKHCINTIDYEFNMKIL